MLPAPSTREAAADALLAAGDREHNLLTGDRGPVASPCERVNSPRAGQQTLAQEIEAYASLYPGRRHPRAGR